MATSEDDGLLQPTKPGPPPSTQAAFRPDGQPLDVHEVGLTTPERRCNHSQVVSTDARTLLHC